MIRKLMSLSIRTHLVVLLVLLALPCILVTVYAGLRERGAAIGEAKQDCLRFIEAIAGQQQAIVAGAQQLAAALALVPEVQSHDTGSVNTLLSDLLKKNPQYTNISVADGSGILWASALPLEGKISLADRRHFQDTVRSGVFSSGEYVMGRTVHKAIITFGYPVKNTANKLVAVIVVALDLDYARRTYDRLGLPSGVSFSLLDHRGVTFIRYPGDAISERIVGQRDIREELFTRMAGGAEEGTFEATGNDGKFRLFVYKKIRLPGESEPYLYVRSGVTKASVISKANAAMFRNLALLVLLFGAGMCLVWFVGKRTIVAPVMALKEAAGRLANGAETVNVSESVKGGELGELARAFDGMAEALVQRQADLHKSEERFHVAQDLSLDAFTILSAVRDNEGRIADFRWEYVNPAAAKILRHSSQELIGRRLLEVMPGNKVSSDLFDRYVRVVETGEPHDYELCYESEGIQGWFRNMTVRLGDGIAVCFSDITRRKQAEEERERLISELKDALVQVKTLRGLLPICSSCKRILNNKGSWEQMEVYIRDRTEADFSHGICPECAARLYPEYVKKSG